MQTKEKVRVYALAKTLDVESKLILDHCRDLGYDVKNQLSGLETDQAEIVKQRILKGAKSGAAAEPARPVATGPVIPPKDRTIVKVPVSKPAPKPFTPPAPPAPTLPAPVAEVVAPVPVMPPPVAPIAIAPVVPTPPVAPPLKTSPAPMRTMRTIRTPSPKAPVAPPAPVAEQAPVAEPKIEEQPPIKVEPQVSPLEESKPTPSPVVAPSVVVESPVIAEPIAPTLAAEIPAAKIERPEATPTPAVTTPAAPITPPAPARLPMNTPRVMNLNAPRPISGDRPPRAANPATTAPPAAPKTPAASMSPPPAAPARPIAPPARTPGGNPPNPSTTSPGGRMNLSGSGARPGMGSGGAGGPGRGGPGERNRRMGIDRKPGAASGQRPGGPGGAGPTGQGGGGGARPPLPGRDDKKTPPPVPKPQPRVFTAEELAQLRTGVTVNEMMRKQQIAEKQKDAVPPGPDGGTGGEELDEEGKKRGLPGKIVGRDGRHVERAKRQEKRKAKDTVVIKDGQVEVVEENSGRRWGRRPKPKIKLPGTIERKGKVPITLPMTVRTLSAATGLKVNELIFKLKDLTQSLFTINTNVDVEVAELIAEEKGIELEIIRPKDMEQDLVDEHTEAADDSSKLELRAPVVTIMGHVDHGKTSLLDRIRQEYGVKSDVVSTEAGGITQVIRAWRVEKDGKPVTFLDTPGHEAFTKMRARGANVTDIAVIVVAADDGVMPQTTEAIAHARAAGVSIMVVINKIDLPNANIKKTEQQLYSLSLLPDSMGGDCQFVYTSAATGKGIDDLLENLSLLAEIKELKANPHKPARGTCLEAYLSGDEGVMATVLVQEGTLHRGDIVLCGAASGRVRAMYDDHGRPIKEAGPSMPVRITGLDEAPNADDHFHVVTELGRAAEIASKRKQKMRESLYNGRVAVKLEDFGKSENKVAELKIILKAEAKGSIEAIKKELEKLVHDEVRVRVLHAGIGAISESDVDLALASPEDSMVIGFNVVPDDNALRFAEERKIPIREYDIIYKLTNDIKAALEGKLKPREDVIHLGRAVIRETFKISKVGTIAGCYVTQGTIERSAKIRVIREGAVIYPPPERSASLESLKRFKDDAREVREGYDCGIKVAGYDDLKVGDVIEAYRIEHVKRTL